MNRKISSHYQPKPLCFFGLSTAISCKEEASDKTIPLLNKTAKGSVFG